MTAVPDPDGDPDTDSCLAGIGDGELRIASVQHGSGRAVVTVTGALGIAGLLQLGAHLHGLLDGGTGYLLLDLSEAIAVDPGLRGQLDGVRARLDRLDGALLLTGAGGELEDLQTAVTLPDLLALYRTGRPRPVATRAAAVVVRLDGELDRRHRDRVTSALRAAATDHAAIDGAADLVLDATEVRFIDITSIGLLIDLAAGLRPGRRLIVTAAEHLQLSRLLAIWPDPVANIVVRPTTPVTAMTAGPSH